MVFSRDKTGRTKLSLLVSSRCAGYWTHLVGMASSYHIFFSWSSFVTVVVSSSMIDDDNPSIIIKKKKNVPHHLLHLYHYYFSRMVVRCCYLGVVSIRLLETDLLVLAPTNINTCSRDAKPTPKTKSLFERPPLILRSEK